MANSAEGVGQLLANSALMKGERELFRKRDGPPAETSTPTASQPSAAPIANDSKVVSAVLLTLLDEQLQADAALMGKSGTTSGNGESDASKRVAAKYAADGLIAGDDLIAPQQPVQPDLARAGNVPPIASPDLQTFMQRFVAIVSGRPATASTSEVGSGRSSRGHAPVAFGTASVLRVAGVATGLIWVIILVAVWAAH